MSHSAGDAVPLVADRVAKRFGAVRALEAVSHTLP